MQWQILRQLAARRAVVAHNERKRQEVPFATTERSTRRLDRANDDCDQISGHVQSRTTTTERMLRRWNSCFWLFEEPATIIFFKSDDHMRQWIATRKEHFASLRVDFDTMGVLQTVDKAREKRIRTPSTNKKLLSTRMKYAFTEVQTRVYGKEVIHSFKLERWTDVGVDVVAAFGSAQPAEITALRSVMHDCIRLANPHKKKELLHQTPCQSYRSHNDMDGKTQSMTEMTGTIASLRLGAAGKRTG